MTEQDEPESSAGAPLAHDADDALREALALLEEARSSVRFDSERYAQLCVRGSTHTIRAEAGNECGRLGVLLGRIDAAIAAKGAP